tara:strand:+ start:46332 stop:47573 length:1242 start_codon:yes stop_codon:yes gene_type:complete
MSLLNEHPETCAKEDLVNTSKSGGKLFANIIFFARILRISGISIALTQITDCLKSVTLIGISTRKDFYWALFSCLVKNRNDKELFDQAFYIFWKDPKILEKFSNLTLPNFSENDFSNQDDKEISRRLMESIYSDHNLERRTNKNPEVDFDASLTWSAAEQLSKKDFEKMSSNEINLAIKEIRKLKLPISELTSRRFKYSYKGKYVDMKQTIRSSFRSGADLLPLIKRDKVKKKPPLVALCDISGSMESYSRMLLHFLHAVTNDRDRVHTFLFGTKLTNVTHHLKYKDVDEALEKVGAVASDWAGGTKIGQSLLEFNKIWSRRVLSQGALVILITDGLDRDEGSGLSGAIQRLHMSCRHLLWLNPLLRYDKFEPKSIGIRAMLPHVDDFRSIHNIASIKDLSSVISRDSNYNCR